MTTSLKAALAAIPDGLRDPLIELFEGALSEYRASRWEATGTKVGKLCEVVYSIAAGATSGVWPAGPSKPKNMVDDGRALEKHTAKHGRSLCIQIPRILIAAYELRNNRDIGHVGSGVDPNHMDAEFLIRCAKWLVAELVRVFAKLSEDDARAMVESVTERSFQVVWSEGDAKRVLNPKMSMRDKVLVLLYASGNTATVDQLLHWTEHSNPSVFRSSVLAGLHKEALIHQSDGKATLLPPGVQYVERSGLLTA